MFSDNLEYAAHKLNDSIVKTLEGGHVYVMRVNDIDDVSVHNGQRETTISLDDISEKIPRIGYIVDNKGNPYYGYRVPMRAWKFGINHNNTKFTEFKKKWFDWHNVTVVKSLNKKYTPFYTVMNLEDIKLAPISRHFCVDKIDSYLYYKGDIVATINTKSKEVVFNNRKQYLQEYFSEIVRGQINED